MRPETTPVLLALKAARRRRIVLDVISAVSTAVVTFVVLLWLSRAFVTSAAANWIPAVTALLVGTGVVVRWSRLWSLAALARQVEAVCPDCRNVVVTAEELQRHPERASAWMRETVMGQAARAIAGLPAAKVTPGATAWTAATLAAAASAGFFLVPEARDVARSVAAAATSAVERVGGARTSQVVVRVRPPVYTRLADRTLTNPSRLDVLGGSRLGFTLSGDGSRRVRFGDTVLGELTAGESIEFEARDSGYFAVESAEGGAPLLVVLSVTPDRAPTVLIEQPGRDLLLPNPQPTVPVTLRASDDLGLASFGLRYTRMSGSGEQFQFVEGDVPLRIEQNSTKEWRATASIALADLQLAPGDSIVYYGVARDGRAGAGALGSSDTFFIEIAGPGQVPLDAVGMAPDEDRYALSQQMIVVKIQRLQSKQTSLTRDQTFEEAAMIAAEQRSVRANFIFLLGGHVEDEEVEAEQSSEITEGRLINNARRDINAAVRDMTRAEQGLAAIDLKAALAAARDAVNSLQRAFGRNRYFLRTLSARSRIDPSRRLSGRLDAASGWNRNPTDPAGGAARPARTLAGELTELSNAVARKAGADRSIVERLAERALAIDPSSSTWQTISRRLLDVREVLNRPAEAQLILDDVSAMVRREADRDLLPRTSLSVPASPLLRAWDGRSRR